MIDEILPSEIRVGATKYTMSFEPDIWRKANGCDGMVDFDTLTIHIVTEDRPLSDVLNTVLHELLHVCYREWHIKPRCGEERTVTALGFAQASLYVQNPDLIHGLQLLTEEVIRG